MTSEPIVDSNITLDEALLPEPGKPTCPNDILKRQQLLTVHYLSFDGKIHRGQLVIDEELEADMLEMFEMARELEFPIAKVVPNAHPNYKWNAHKLVVVDNVSAGFNYRKIKDTNELSCHSYGKAIDLNPKQNPYIRYKNGTETVFPENARWDPKKPGTLHSSHRLVQFMELRGWEWGGNWAKKNGVVDYMHFQKTNQL